jgi:hypothetical protein
VDGLIDRGRNCAAPRPNPQVNLHLDDATWLIEAVKFVYASAFSRSAKSYLRAVGKTPADEKMSVITGTAEEEGGGIEEGG